MKKKQPGTWAISFIEGLAGLVFFLGLAGGVVVFVQILNNPIPGKVMVLEAFLISVSIILGSTILFALLTIVGLVSRNVIAIRENTESDLPTSPVSQKREVKPPVAAPKKEHARNAELPSPNMLSSVSALVAELN